MNAIFVENIFINWKACKSFDPLKLLLKAGKMVDVETNEYGGNVLMGVELIVFPVVLFADTQLFYVD